MSGDALSTPALLASALVLLWAFGAYNRLMRERGQVIRVFGALGQAIEDRAAVLLSVSHAQLLHANDGPGQVLWHRLEACVQQAANAMAHAGLNPLAAERVGALGSALAALDDALRAVQERRAKLALAPWPVEIQAQLARCDARLLTQEESFDAAALHYNESIAQFPTLIVARLFGMQPTRVLGSVGHFPPIPASVSMFDEDPTGSESNSAPQARPDAGPNVDANTDVDAMPKGGPRRMDDGHR